MITISMSRVSWFLHYYNKSILLELQELKMQNILTSQR